MYDLPYKDEEEEIFDDGPRPRRRKEAEPIHDQNDSPFSKGDPSEAEVLFPCFYSIFLFSFIGRFFILNRVLVKELEQF